MFLHFRGRGIEFIFDEFGVPSSVVLFGEGCFFILYVVPIGEGLFLMRKVDIFVQIKPKILDEVPRRGMIFAAIILDGLGSSVSLGG
jgi:hypothetical protein